MLDASLSLTSSRTRRSRRDEQEKSPLSRHHANGHPYVCLGEPLDLSHLSRLHRREPIAEQAPLTQVTNEHAQPVHDLLALCSSHRSDALQASRALAQRVDASNAHIRHMQTGSSFALIAHTQKQREHDEKTGAQHEGQLEIGAQEPLYKETCYRPRMQLKTHSTFYQARSGKQQQHQQQQQQRHDGSSTARSSKHMSLHAMINMAPTTYMRSQHLHSLLPATVQTTSSSPSASPATSPLSSSSSSSSQQAAPIVAPLQLPNNDEAAASITMVGSGGGSSAGNSSGHNSDEAGSTLGPYSYREFSSLSPDEQHSFPSRHYFPLNYSANHFMPLLSALSAASASASASASPSSSSSSSSTSRFSSDIMSFHWIRLHGDEEHVKLPPLTARPPQQPPPPPPQSEHTARHVHTARSSANANVHDGSEAASSSSSSSRHASPPNTTRTSSSSHPSAPTTSRSTSSSHPSAPNTSRSAPSSRSSRRTRLRRDTNVRALSPTAHWNKLLRLIDTRAHQATALVARGYFDARAKHHRNNSVDSSAPLPFGHMSSSSSSSAAAAGSSSRSHTDAAPALVLHTEGHGMIGNDDGQILRQVANSRDMEEGQEITKKAELTLARCYADFDLCKRDLKSRLFESLCLLGSCRGEILLHKFRSFRPRFQQADDDIASMRREAHRQRRQLLERRARNYTALLSLASDIDPTPTFEETYVIETMLTLIDDGVDLAPLHINVQLSSPRRSRSPTHKMKYTAPPSPSKHVPTSLIYLIHCLSPTVLKYKEARELLQRWAVRTGSMSDAFEALLSHAGGDALNGLYSAREARGSSPPRAVSSAITRSVPLAEWAWARSREKAQAAQRAMAAQLRTIRQLAVNSPTATRRALGIEKPDIKQVMRTVEKSLRAGGNNNNNNASVNSANSPREIRRKHTTGVSQASTAAEDRIVIESRNKY